MSIVSCHPTCLSSTASDQSAASQTTQWEGRRKRLRYVAQRSLQKGQGMTEYVIIVALVAVAAIAVYQFFGQVIRSQTSAMAHELAGEDGTKASKNAQNAAKKSVTQSESRSLKEFTNNAGIAGGK